MEGKMSMLCSATGEAKKPLAIGALGTAIYGGWVIAKKAIAVFGQGFQFHQFLEMDITGIGLPFLQKFRGSLMINEKRLH
jgi:hypothetical protein